MMMMVMALVFLFLRGVFLFVDELIVDVVNSSYGSSLVVVVVITIFTVVVVVVVVKVVGEFAIGLTNIICTQPSP